MKQYLLLILSISLPILGCEDLAEIQGPADESKVASDPANSNEIPAFEVDVESEDAEKVTITVGALALTLMETGYTAKMVYLKAGEVVKIEEAVEASFGAPLGAVVAIYKGSDPIALAQVPFKNENGAGLQVSANDPSSKAAAGLFDALSDDSNEHENLSSVLKTGFPVADFSKLADSLLQGEGLDLATLNYESVKDLMGPFIETAAKSVDLLLATGLKFEDIRNTSDAVSRATFPVGPELDAQQRRYLAKKAHREELGKHEISDQSTSLVDDMMASNPTLASSHPNAFKFSAAESLLFPSTISSFPTKEDRDDLMALAQASISQEDALTKLGGGAITADEGFHEMINQYGDADKLNELREAKVAALPDEQVKNYMGFVWQNAGSNTNLDKESKENYAEKCDSMGGAISYETGVPTCPLPENGSTAFVKRIEDKQACTADQIDIIIGHDLKCVDRSSPEGIAITGCYDRGGFTESDASILRGWRCKTYDDGGQVDGGNGTIVTTTGDGDAHVLMCVDISASDDGKTCRLPSEYSSCASLDPEKLSETTAIGECRVSLPYNGGDSAGFHP